MCLAEKCGRRKGMFALRLYSMYEFSSLREGGEKRDNGRWEHKRETNANICTQGYSYTNMEHMFKPIASFPPAWCGCKASSASVLFKNQSTFSLVWEPKWCLELSSRSWSHFYGKKIIVNLWDPYAYHSWNPFGSSSHIHYVSGHWRTPYKQLNTKITVCIK